MFLSSWKGSRDTVRVVNYINIEFASLRIRGLGANSFLSGGTFVKIGLLPIWPSERGSSLKGKNSLPWGANSLRFENTPFQKGLCVQECKWEVINSVIIVNKCGKVYSVPLAIFITKQTYSNILNILPTKNENFQIKKKYFSNFCSKYRLWILIRTASRQF